MGVPLVFLPNIGSDARVFRPQIEAFSSDRTVIVAPVSGSARIETIATTLLGSLPPRFALIGQGFGGLVAMELLRQAPPRTDRICLISCSPLPDTPEMAAGRERAIVLAQSGRMTEALAEVLCSGGLSPGAGRAELQALFLSMGNDLGAEALVRQIRALQRRRDQQATLRRCKVPALVLGGSDDPVLPPKRHAFLADLMPCGRFVPVENAGQAPTLEQPEFVNRTLRDWLDKPLLLNSPISTGVGAP